jgi:hypothetical protein
MQLFVFFTNVIAIEGCLYSSKGCQEKQDLYHIPALQGLLFHREQHNPNVGDLSDIYYLAIDHKTIRRRAFVTVRLQAPLPAKRIFGIGIEESLFKNFVILVIVTISQMMSIDYHRLLVLFHHVCIYIIRLTCQLP